MKLKKYLSDKKIKLVEFSKMVDYEKGNLSRIVNCKMQPSLKLAIKIKNLTNGEVQPEDLIINKGE